MREIQFANSVRERSSAEMRMAFGNGNCSKSVPWSEWLSSPINVLASSRADLESARHNCELTLSDFLNNHNILAKAFREALIPEIGLQH